MTSYCHSVVTMSLSHVIFEIFEYEKYHDLEIQVRAESRSSPLGLGVLLVHWKCIAYAEGYDAEFGCCKSNGIDVCSGFQKTWDCCPINK